MELAYYTNKEAASRLKVHPKTAIRMGQRKEVPGLAKFGGRWVWQRKELDAFIARSALKLSD